MKKIDIKTLAGAWGKLVLKYRWPLIVLAVILFGITFYFQRLVPMESSVEDMVLSDDPDRLALERFRDIFGSDQILIAVFSGIDLNEPKVYDAIENYRRTLCAAADFQDCLAITNITDVTGRDGEVLVEPLLTKLPADNEEAKAIFNKALKRRDYLNLFYNESGTAAAVIARLNPPRGEREQKYYQDKVYNEAHRLAASQDFSGYNIYLAGNPIIKKDLSDYQAYDLKRFMFVLYGMLVLFLALTHRRLPGVVLPLSIVVLTLYSLMTIIYFTGKPLSIVGCILPPLMLVYGISIASHIYIRYTEWLQRCAFEKNKALVGALASVIGACFYNALTTAFGFGANTISDIAPVKDFGISAAIGVLLALIVSFLFALPILSLFPPPKPLAVSGEKKSDPIGQILKFVSAFVRRRYKWILASNLFISAIAIYGMTQIKVETKLIEYFNPDTPIYQAYHEIEKDLAGISSIEVVFEGAAEQIKDPVVLKQLAKFNNELRQNEHIRNSTSLADYVMLMNRALWDDDPSEWRIPDKKEAIAQLLLLYESSEFAADLWRYVSEDYSSARIAARVDSISSSALVAMVKDIKEQAKELENTLPGVKIAVTGSGVIYANMVNSLVLGQVKSFGLSLLLITILMIIIAGNVPVGLVSLIPNLIPILIVMGIMGYFHISLDATTAMVAPVALGMAVDSTIHYMVRFRRECLLNGHDYLKATDTTISTIGRAMMATSLPLAGGFFVLLLASFMPTYYFGMLSGTIALLAMFYDLFVTPSALLLLKPLFKEHKKSAL